MQTYICTYLPTCQKASYFQREEVRKMIGDMLSKGIIETSTSAWSSPVVLEKKKRDGGTRFCIDKNAVYVA